MMDQHPSKRLCSPDMSKQAGRPQDNAIRTALIRAAESLIMENGLTGVSIEAIAVRAETTRPSFYRRFDGVPAIILAVLEERFSTTLDEDFDTGNLPADLQSVQHEQVALFSDRLITRCLAGFLDSLHGNEQLQGFFLENFLAPRRAATAAILHRAIDRDEIPPGPDVEWICDLLTGPLVLRAVMPGLQPLDDMLISNTVTSALAALGYQPAGENPSPL